MEDLDQDKKRREDQDDDGPPCLLTRDGRDCRGNRVGAAACIRCGWNPDEHQRRVRLPLVENDKGLLHMSVEQPRTIEEG